MRNKKAMSEIVTTVIMVVLALVAVAVIWQIINNLISEKGAQISITQKCLDVKISVSSVSDCTADGCTVRVSRAAGGDAFEGVKVVLKNAANSSLVMDYSNNIPELGTVNVPATLDVADPFDASTANKVEVTPYFVDESGQNKFCPSSATYNFNQ